MIFINQIRMKIGVMYGSPESKGLVKILYHGAGTAAVDIISGPVAA